MDMMKQLEPTFTMMVNYKAFNNLVSSVRADLFNIEDKTLLVVATEVEGNNGPSITNSIECFAKRIKTLFPTFNNYQFVECYRWDGEKPTFDKVTFLEKDFERPTWRRLDDSDLVSLVTMINMKQVKGLEGQTDATEGEHI